MTPRAPGWRPLAALLAVAGATHLTNPRIYEPLVPPRLGDPRPWVLWSGVAELACAGALLPRRTRQGGALAAAALFVAVYPGNVQQALDAQRRGSRGAKVVTLARLPMQGPLVWWALRLARQRRRQRPRVRYQGPRRCRVRRGGATDGAAAGAIRG